MPIIESTESVGEIPAVAVDHATAHIGDILSIAIEHSDKHNAVVVFDSGCDLALALAAAYRRCIPNARFIDFDATPAADVHAAFAPLEPADLVVLIQSTAFRLDAYRLRVELFKRALKVIEHVHLARMPGIHRIAGLRSCIFPWCRYRVEGADRSRSAWCR